MSTPCCFRMHRATTGSIRSRLWSPERQLKRDALPSMGEMLADQTGLKAPPETQAEMLARYQADL